MVIRNDNDSIIYHFLERFVQTSEYDSIGQRSKPVGNKGFKEMAGDVQN